MYTITYAIIYQTKFYTAWVWSLVLILELEVSFTARLALPPKLSPKRQIGVHLFVFAFKKCTPDLVACDTPRVQFLLVEMLAEVLLLLDEVLAEADYCQSRFSITYK